MRRGGGVGGHRVRCASGADARNRGAARAVARGRPGRPRRLGGAQILFGVDAGRGRLLHRRNAHRDAVREWAQLLQALHALERVHRERDPPRERLARVGVDADVAAHEGVARGRVAGVARLAEPRDRGAREVERASVVRGDELDHVGPREHVGRRGACRGAEREAARRDDARGAGEHGGADERLVTLDVEHGVEPLVRGARGHLGDAVGARRDGPRA
jgi:hypothetical protein